MIKQKIEYLIKESIKELQKDEVLPVFEIPKVIAEYPREKTHGDYSCSIALQISKIIKKKPVDTAKLIMESIDKKISKQLFSKTEVAGGFINFFIASGYLQQQVREIIKQKDKFGSLNLGGGEKINIEFISANPTGPLTLGNGRGGFCGDVLSNILEKAGYQVTREYYINNRGVQIEKLGHSVLADSQAVYKGKYIDELKKQVDGKNPAEIGERAAQIILEELIKPTIKRMGISFDVWASEKVLYNRGDVDRAIEEFTKKGFTYKSEGATWFKSKELEDDKDRVLIRADGERTYFASDIAYLQNKINRGFGKIILFLGADHYGYVARLKAAAHVLGFDKDNLNAIVMQLVGLFKDGKEVRMSKREGVYVTLDELLDEVGLDAARFFFLQRSPNTHLNFDLGLAKERSQKNPVYYVQYAHARICSMLRKTSIFSRWAKPTLDALKESSELDLIKQLAKLPEVIESTSEDFQIQRITQYTLDVADAFHRFYENCQVLCEDKKLKRCRLDLVLATKIVLKNTLDLMGISAPKKM